MPDYNVNIQGPNLGGLNYNTVNAPDGAGQATAALVGEVGSLVAKTYGRYAAGKAGKAIGGDETYEAAGIAAADAENELVTLSQEKQALQGRDITEDQAKDLRDQVFGRVLTNQKRIQSALSRGLISSTEATARLSVLRNEALSNPLIAPFQNQLDNALYKTTGGSGSTFAATAAEQQAAAKKKGELAALEDTQKQVSTLVQTGVAANEKQALSYIAQIEEQKRQMAFLEQKRAILGLNSQEVFAANQTFQTQQATSAYAAIAQWQASGGQANQKQAIQLKLVQDGEMTKQAIRARAFGKDGQLLIQSEQLTAQLAEVDKRVKDYTSMLDDQAGTKKLTDQIAQLTAAMDLKSTEINVDLSKRLPIVYALKDQPVPQKWYIDTVTGTNQLKNEWMKSTNPIMKVIASLPDTELNDQVSNTGEKFLNSGNLNDTDKAILSTTLMNRGGSGAADLAYKSSPEAALKNLRETPFSIKSLANNDEWKRKASTPEGVDQIAAVIEGAAQRVIVNSAYNPERFSQNKRYSTEPSLSVPKTVKVTPIANGATVSTNDRKLGRGYGQWMIDTGGVPVSDTYKSEITNAFKLGTEQPKIWQDDFKSIDEWINHLFTRQ